jgi:transcription elongation GreA/GreB family factor
MVVAWAIYVPWVFPLGITTMDKRKVIAEIQNFLAQELSELASALEKPGQIEPEAMPGVAARVEEIQQLLMMYKFLPVRTYTSEDVVCPGGLVELELNRVHAYYLMVPKGGGLVARVEGSAVQVITPNSPLGEALLGKRVGDEAQVEVAGKLRHYRLVGYC